MQPKMRAESWGGVSCVGRSVAPWSSTPKTTIRTAAPWTRRSDDLVKSVFLPQEAPALVSMALAVAHWCAVGFACARQRYGSRSWSGGKWASFTPSASYIWLCRGGTVGVEKEEPDPGVVWRFDPGEKVSRALKLVPYFRAARFRDMWQWEGLRVWKGRE